MGELLKKTALPTKNITKTIIRSKAYDIMQEHQINGEDLMHESDYYEVTASKGHQCGLNRTTLNKIKKGLNVHVKSLHKFITAVNIILKKRGNEIQYSINDLF